MRATPKITSFPAARWRNTGRPATTMRFARFAIRRCYNAQTERMGFLPSISLNKIAERRDNLFQHISEVVGTPNGKSFGTEIGKRINLRAGLHRGCPLAPVPKLAIHGVNR